MIPDHNTALAIVGASTPMTSVQQQFHTPMDGYQLFNDSFTALTKEEPQISHTCSHQYTTHHCSGVGGYQPVNLNGVVRFGRSIFKPVLEQYPILPAHSQEVGETSKVGMTIVTTKL